MAYFATRPEWNAVPACDHEDLVDLSQDVVAIRSSSIASRPFTTRPTSVSRIALGCSWISFSNEVIEPAFLRASHVPIHGDGLGVEPVPVEVVNTAPSRRASTT